MIFFVVIHENFFQHYLRRTLILSILYLADPLMVTNKKADEKKL